MKSKSKCIVVDTSIAKAAGGENAVHPMAKQCRDFLRNILTICHKVVLTDEIDVEWKNHQSNFTRTWRLAMISRKKLIIKKACQIPKLQEAICKSSKRECDLQAMKKDLLLINAAHEHDKIIASLDNTVKKLFCDAAVTSGNLKTIVWVNPCEDHDVVISWLKAGAKAEKK
ncbi:MAG: hypothetical protein HGB32_14135, partial [Geobacteraceae bacterium]|nr:hypothetical protein [Geobacteraceae bacterium]